MPVFNIYLAPATDPFVIDADAGGIIVPNIQPRATISFVTLGAGGATAVERPRETWQTTVTSRLYQR